MEDPVAVSHLHGLTTLFKIAQLFVSDGHLLKNFRPVLQVWLVVLANFAFLVIAEWSRLSIASEMK